MIGKKRRRLKIYLTILLIIAVFLYCCSSTLNNVCGLSIKNDEIHWTKAFIDVFYNGDRSQFSENNAKYFKFPWLKLIEMETKHSTHFQRFPGCILNHFQIGKKWKHGSHLETFFRPAMTVLETVSMFKTFEVLLEELKTARITLMLYGGTLLGAYRHDGIIPWDDDIDIMVRGTQKDKLRSTLKENSRYKLYSPYKAQWKFFSNTTKGNAWLSKEYRWPYVDIFFYEENETHIWDEIEQYREGFMFKKSDVFPMKYRLFNGVLLPTPKNIKHVLLQSYDIDMCLNLKYLHKNNSISNPHERKTVLCSELYSAFPFSTRYLRNS